MAVFEIPLNKGQPQTLSIALGGVKYRLTFRYVSISEGGWVLDIAAATGEPLVLGIPLVTGADLLAQFQYLNFNGRLQVQTITDPDAVPTFESLGDTAKVFWIT